jgi:hypothetical protein
MVKGSAEQTVKSLVQKSSGMQNSPEVQQTMRSPLQPAYAAVIDVNTEFSLVSPELIDTSSKSPPREAILMAEIADAVVPEPPLSDTTITPQVDWSKKRTKIDFTTVSPTYERRRKKKVMTIEQGQCSPEERKRSTVEITQSVISQYLVNEAHEKLQSTFIGDGKGQSKDSEKENRPEGYVLGTNAVTSRLH